MKHNDNVWINVITLNFIGKTSVVIIFLKSSYAIFLASNAILLASNALLLVSNSISLVSN